MIDWTEGERVSFTDKLTGVTSTGSVESIKKGWVMITLDEPIETPQHWTAHRMVVREEQLRKL